jgi:hypothetical protein
MILKIFNTYKAFSSFFIKALKELLEVLIFLYTFSLIVKLKLNYSL